MDFALLFNIIYTDIINAVLLAIIIKVFVKLTSASCRSATCLVGKTAIVTGGNSGIGYQVALNFASRGCRVIIADKDNCDTSCGTIKTESGNPNVIWKHVDLACLESVRKFANYINETEERLDILVNNAGCFGCAPEKNNDNLNKIMQVNYFGHFLLTHLLIDLLKKSLPSRVVFTSSLLAYFTFFHIENLSVARKIPIPFLSDYFSYGNSKLCIIMACREFSKRLSKSGITFNAVHPGFVSTNFVDSYRRSLTNKKFSAVTTYIFQAIVPFLTAKSPQDGAATILEATLAKKFEKFTGTMFMECTPINILPLYAYRDSLCKEVWRESEKIVKLKESEKLAS